MRDSIIMTVYNRPERVLMNTLYALTRNPLKGCEIIVVDDGSTHGYPAVKDFIRDMNVSLEWISVNTCVDRPGTYHINCSCTKRRSSTPTCKGYNNPTYAWNVALDAARGSRIVTLSSDCIVPPHMMDHARRESKRVWMSNVVDMDSGMIYLGKPRIYPMGWCMSWRKEDAPNVRWDENFLRGVDFDDNDITGQLFVTIGQFIIDPKVTIYHQSHPAVAYSDGSFGHDMNRKYCREKWGGGIPWMKDAGMPDPFDWRVCYNDDGIVLVLQGGEAAAVSSGAGVG